ncbi:MAG: hypothetical protein ACD_58C00129G0002 [uncultured bacterium]|nr:MAG: hypothetical protein ACD_58C00129G0002 [uncultured bacterium]
MKLTNSLKIALVIAVILRLVISGITFHPDLSGQLLSGYFFGYKNIFNIYDYLVSLPQTHPLVANFGVGDIFIYPPLTYFTLGSFLKLFSWLVPENFFLDLMNGVAIYGLPSVSLRLITFKIPYLLVDIATAFAMASLFDDAKKKSWAFILWLFNPVTFYTTFAMGVFDIIPVLFTVLSLYYAKKKNFYMSAIMISIGAAYKQYPIFLLPFIIFSAKDFWTRFKILLCGITPYLITIAPFLSSSAFKYMVFGAKSQKMFYMEWMVTGAEGIYPYLLGVILIYLHAIRNMELDQKLWKYFLAYFLVLFSVTHYHPQWFIWVAPFIIIEMVTSNWRNLWLDLTLLACYIFIVLTFDNSLSVGLFAVINQNLNSFPGIDKLLSSKTDLVFLKSSVRSLFASVSIFLILDLFFHQGDGKNKLKS